MRTGLIAKKIGMSNYYTPNGVNIPVTILHVEACKVVERVTDENSKLDKLLIGADEIKKLRNLWNKKLPKSSSEDTFNTDEIKSQFGETDGFVKDSLAIEDEELKKLEAEQKLNAQKTIKGKPGQFAENLENVEDLIWKICAENNERKTWTTTKIRTSTLTMKLLAFQKQMINRYLNFLNFIQNIARKCFFRHYQRLIKLWGQELSK